MAEAPRCPYRDLVNELPFDFYAQLREVGAPVWDDSMGGWLVSTYEDCAYVERHEELFAHPYGAFDGAAKVKGARSILLLQGEEHRRMHRWLAGELSKPASLERARQEFIGPLTDQLLEAYLGSGPVDFTDNFAEQLPISVIAALLGLPWEDRDLLRRCRELNDEFIRWSETFGEAADVLASASAAADEMDEILRPYIRARRTDPRDDLISALWAEGPSLLEDWSEDDVLSQAKTLFPAGGQTSAYLLANMMYLLVTDEELMKVVTSDPEKHLVGFIEETLRLHGSIHFRVREALADTELNGVTIVRGQKVFPINSSANRDAAKFPDPDRLLLEGRKGKHLAFNVGPRICVGEAFSRAEAHEAFLHVLATRKNIRLAGTAPEPRLAGFLSRSFRPVVIDFDRA